MKIFIISIDQGTTSSRVILFDTKGNIVFVSQFEFKQYFPKNGWVEHNPNEIWFTTLKALKQVINKAKKLKGHILTIGITNQRETTILWNKKTGKPIYNAIVWQDRRTQDYCKLLKKKNYENLFRNKTGLFIDPYFSATKIKWILDNVKISKKLLSSNDLLFGTVDTFLIWKLTKGKQHLTEASNASRTMLYNINNNKWDKEILKKLNNSKHYLISSVCISKNGSMIWNYSDSSELKMKNLTDTQLSDYLSKVETKTLLAYGVYQIEAKGFELFEYIKGDKDSIMGLPIKDIINYIKQY